MNLLNIFKSKQPQRTPYKKVKEAMFLDLPPHYRALYEQGEISHSIYKEHIEQLAELVDPDVKQDFLNAWLGVH